jgi:hypothetical protein
VSVRHVTLLELDDVLAMEVRGAVAPSRAHVEGFPRTEDLDALAAWERGAMGFLIVDRLGSVVGTCGTHGPVRDGALELGWGLVESARGVGVGGEAVDLLVDAVRARFPSARVVVRTEWDVLDGIAAAVSPASEAILERRGFLAGPAPSAKAQRNWTLSARSS